VKPSIANTAQRQHNECSVMPTRGPLHRCTRISKRASWRRKQQRCSRKNEAGPNPNIGQIVISRILHWVLCPPDARHWLHCSHSNRSSKTCRWWNPKRVLRQYCTEWRVLSRTDSRNGWRRFHPKRRTRRCRSSISRQVAAASLSPPLINTTYGSVSTEDNCANSVAAVRPQPVRDLKLGRRRVRQ